MKIRHFPFVQSFDRSTVAVLMQRGWGILAGASSLVIVTLWMTPLEQGYYFAFSGLIALQVFFEMGFNSIILQLVGHEYAHFTEDKNERSEKELMHRARLASLMTLVHRWYQISAIFFVFLVCPIGIIFFRDKTGLPAMLWIGPWISSVAFTGLNLYLSPFLVAAEGEGDVAEVARLRLVASMLGYLLFWLMLAMGSGLWAISALPATSAVNSALWLKRRSASRSKDVYVDLSYKISWKNEILPYQWRVSLSWISGYFIFSFFTPVIFKYQGAIEAGRLGLTLSIFGSLSTLGMSWVSAKTPHFAMLVAKNNRSELNHQFGIAFVKSFTFTSVSICLFLAISFTCQNLGFVAIHRISNFPVQLSLAVATLSNVVIFSLATFMRAHKEEPMLWVSIALGLTVLTSTWYCAKISTELTMLIYASLVFCLALPWTLIIFRQQFINRFSQESTK